jgi:hypothetical protein
MHQRNIDSQTAGWDVLVLIFIVFHQACLKGNLATLAHTNEHNLVLDFQPH